MTRKTIVALAAVTIFAAAASASVLHSLTTTTAAGFDHSFRASNNKPYYLKARILDGCFDHSPECMLLAW